MKAKVTSEKLRETAKAKTMPLEERLARKMKVNPVSGCYEWQGSKLNGYGRITFGNAGHPERRTTGTHRLAYELAFGPIPNGLQVCHKCDNRSCINVEHLFLGTNKDNADDRETKGRGNQALGSKSSMAKLDEEKILEIRKLKANGARTCELSAKYEVHKSTIKRVISGEHWSHVKGENC